uniref:Beta-1,3-glucosyltransferase n=1 Tax=Romanomermis culicivorax TaxID=13658 RepID=A0A915L9A3_ROMCU
EDIFLGYALHDRHPTIIHHYAFVNDPTKFSYPDFARGFVLSTAVLLKLKQIVQGSGFKFNFAIDAKHELAMMLWNNGRGSTLLHNESFCTENSSECITNYQTNRESCRYEFSIRKNFKVAVKTYQKFHRTRSMYLCLLSFLLHGFTFLMLSEFSEAALTFSAQRWEFSEYTFVSYPFFVAKHLLFLVPVVKNTWAKKYNGTVEYFSDSNDPDIPTVKVKVRNTDRGTTNVNSKTRFLFAGHCGKTFIIMSRFVQNFENNENKWLIIVDDDTLISLERLEKLVKCFDLEEKIIIGERYGFGFSASGDRGYDYPTGGSGMIFSPTAVKVLTEKCNCPSLDSPDDMIIGMCARNLGIPIIHNGAFHQARPEDYSIDYISRLKPISFHKHYEIDPYDVYRKYLLDNTTETAINHDEF